MTIQAGLKKNWKQFTLLVIINAFVGGMVGLERSIIPQIAEVEFGLSSKSITLSFITAFGITKAIANYFTGRFANRIGRKNLLLIGWVIALPIPFLLIFANNWSWVILANGLLGLSQGLTWSSTVMMKIDLVGDKQRGLAMGINEFAGYLSVGIMAFLTGYIADSYGLRPYPFYLGIALSVLGFIFTLLWVKDTGSFVLQEAQVSKVTQIKNVFWATTLKDKTLSSVIQAGLVNNLNDGMIWGLLPVWLFHLKFDNHEIGLIASVYPTLWGISQLFTGRLSDFYSKKKMLYWGMLIQGVGIILLVFNSSFHTLMGLSALLGIGTALVYPTFIATIAQVTNPVQRAESLGIFRFWRDLGYAIGAILSGIVADRLGVDIAIIMVGILTIVSSLVIYTRMPDISKQ